MCTNLVYHTKLSCALIQSREFHYTLVGRAPEAYSNQLVCVLVCMCTCLYVCS